MNSDILSSDVPARLRSAAREANTVTQHADLLDRARDPDKALVWRGSADEAPGCLSDLTAIAVELARRGLRATVDIEPTASGELVAAVHLAA